MMKLSLMDDKSTQARLDSSEPLDSHVKLSVDDEDDLVSLLLSEVIDR